MTAHPSTHAGDEKTGVPTDREVAIINHLRERNGETTVADLVAGVGRSRSKVKRSIEMFHERGLVTVRSGYSATRVTLHTGLVDALDLDLENNSLDTGEEIFSDGGSTMIGTLPMDVETIHEVIQSERRRLLIYALAELGRDHEGDGPYIPVGEIASVLTEASQNDDTTRNAVYITLIQHHLGKLDDAGVITYFERAKKIHPESPVYGLESLLLEIECMADSNSAEMERGR